MLRNLPDTMLLPRVHSDPGWDLASYRHMMPATSLTEFICLNFWKIKARLALRVLELES